MLRKLIYLTSFLCAAANMHAQEEDWGTNLASAQFKAKKVIPPTPEAAALGKYGNLPMSLFTGTPNITVPIYQLAGNNISLPIQLSYNAGGFNPQEIAPWTGLGWSLSSGGVITRSVSGNPDDYWNYFISPSPLVAPSQFTDPYGYYDYMENLRKGNIEAQPDMYYYNFAGHSGKFLINPDGTFLKKEKNNYLISGTIPSTTNSNIFITDDQGVSYEFMQFEVSTFQTDDMATDVPVRTFNYPSTWYLTRIVSADGFEEITFTYYTTSLEHCQFSNYNQNQSNVYEETIYSNGSPSFYGPSLKSSATPVVKTKRKYIQQIDFKKAGQLLSYIVFESSVDQRQDLDHSTSGFPGERLLNSIKVYTKKTGTTFTLTKQVNLNYSYFTNNNNSHWSLKRLRLDNIQEVPVITGTVTPPPYSFEYNNDNLMPGLSTTSMDHWGFYNLGNGGGSLIPYTNTAGGNINITAENRLPSLAGSSSYLINKIKYPTGGYTMFEYELNKGKQSDYPGAPVFDVGGVRIKKITDYSFNTKKAQEKTYEYLQTDATTSGKAMVAEYLSSSSYNQYGIPPPVSPWADECIDDWLLTKNTYTVSANSVIGLGSVQGSHIGYSRVTESITDVSNAQPLGKTVYEYYVAEGSWDPHNDDIGNGDLLKKTVYDNGGKLIQEVTNTYNYVLQGSIGAATPGMAAAQDNFIFYIKTNTPGIGISYDWYIGSSCATNAVETRIYKKKFVNNGWSVSSKHKQLTQQFVKQYDQLTNSYLTITKNFTYGNTAHTLPTKVEQTTSNNEVVMTEKKYPLDYTIPTGTLDNNTTGIKLQKDKNIIGAEVESIQYRQNADGTNKRYVTGMFTAYNPYIPYPSQLYRLELSAPLTTFTMSATTGGVFSYNSNYKLMGSLVYTGNGALLQQSKDQDISSAYIWDYDYQYATAEVANAETGQIAYSSFESDGTGEWTTIPNLSTYRVTGGITGKYSYNLTSGNSITKTGLSTARQYKISYWSSNGSITVTATPSGSPSPVTGAVHGAWTYYEHILPLNTTGVTLAASGKTIDELRLYPKDAYMTTVAYDPGVGAISQNSPNNEIVSFEYDGLNRLLNAKDEDANIVKNFKYNFGSDLSSITPSVQSLFYSAVKQGTYTRQGCPSPAEGTAVIYVVPYGKYVALDQPTADNKAQADVNANGQTYANANGQCLYWNTTQSAYFSKNDCLYEQGTSVCSNSGPVSQRWRILYTVAAHTYSSLSDQTTADGLAMAAVMANGQNYANTYCWCSCTAEGQKYINGSCETGTRYNSSTTYIGGGLWECTYYYQWSDYSVSQFYTETNTSPCPIY